jgi:hypothetical protein
LETNPNALLGMGDKLFAVPWSALGLVSKGMRTGGTIKEDYCVLNVSKDALKNAPGFDKDNWPDFANKNFTADIERFYSGQQARRSTSPTTTTPQSR